MSDNPIERNLTAYKRKYYFNFLLKGIIITLSLLLLAFLFYNLLEYFAHFNSVVRSVMFYSYIALAVIALGRWILIPGIRILFDSLQLSNEEAAKQIGEYFPAISDKLINILQLKKQNPDNVLASASIDQKSKEIGHIKFDKAINYRANRKYIVYLIIPFIVVLFLGLSFPKVINESTTRIINYNKEFKPVAPFRFVLRNNELLAFKNEDYQVDLAIIGDLIPENVYLHLGERKVKLQSKDPASYTYTFNKLSKDVSFYFEAAGFNSEKYSINVVNRPNIKNFNVTLDYPSYLGRDQERFSNIGNLQVPEGTRVDWNYQTIFTDSMYMQFEAESSAYALHPSDNQIFEFQKRVEQSQDYEISLVNEYTSNKDRIRYHLEVIPDEYPRISVNQYADTVLYEFLILGGNISDDYGFRDLRLFYSITDRSGIDQEDKYESIALNIEPNKNSQNYYFNWDLQSFNLKQSNKISYYLEVRDNDGINGSKASRTGIYHFMIPGEEELEKELERSSQAAENQMDKSLQKAKELNEKLDEIENRLKGKKQMSWQDQKMMEGLIKDKQDLSEDIEQIQELSKANNLKEERFKELDEKLQEKAEQLQELLDELLNEETKKMYEELAKLLEEKKDLNEIKNMLKKLNLNEMNLERELERALELYKRLKYEKALNETIDELKKIENEQKDLSDQTLDESNEQENTENRQEDPSGKNPGELNEQENLENQQKENSGRHPEESNKQETNENQQEEPAGQTPYESNELKDLEDQQKKLNQEFRDFQKSFEELLDMNQELEFPNRIENTIEEEQTIQREQQNSLEELQKGNKNKAGQSQKNASDQMQKMREKMESMKASGQMMEMQQNFEDLRGIVDNLLKLSFTQEEIMEGFRSINQSDPRFIELSQKQLKLQDDAKVIEDSLLALSKRVMMISSFITREVSEMNKYMEESMESLKERKKAEAAGKQQFAMTSMNNLALLLDDVLSMMQQQLANMMMIPQQGNQQKGNPQLSELQKQLNEQMSELKKSGKTGKELSEELARLAAEQEKIRRKLQEEGRKLEQMNNSKGQDGSLGDIAEKMEQTEIELVNKQLTERLIQRQQEILTRLLDAEDALREQELDEEREAKSAKKIPREIPPEFEEYLKAKEKEIELLRTLPPKLNPYYKKEVMEYFNRLENTIK